MWETIKSTIVNLFNKMVDFFKDLLRKKAIEYEKELEDELSECLCDDEIEKGDSKAKKCMNEIAVKLVLYLKHVRLNEDKFPTNFVTCADLTLLYDYLSKGLTGRGMKLALDLIEIGALDHTIRKNKNTIQVMAGQSDVSLETIELMKTTVAKQEALLKAMTGSKDRIQANYERQQKEISNKKS